MTPYLLSVSHNHIFLPYPQEADCYPYHLCQKKHIEYIVTDKQELYNLVGKVVHQGIVAKVKGYDYTPLNEILASVPKGKQPLLLMLDGLEDPHNLGAIIRTAETAGVHGVIIPKRRAASVNSTVNKVSAGAVEHMKVARVNNINDTIQYLKDNGLWIIGTDGKAENYKLLLETIGELTEQPQEPHITTIEEVIEKSDGLMILAPDNAEKKEELSGNLSEMEMLRSKNNFYAGKK